MSEVLTSGCLMMLIGQFYQTQLSLTNSIFILFRLAQTDFSQ